MFEIVGDSVLRVEEVKTRKQTATVRMFHDMVYHTKVTADKASITADGEDVVTVTARIYNWENNFRVGDDRDVHFEVDGVPVGSVQAVNGIATIEVRASNPGYLTIRTSNPDIRNGDVLVTAIA